MRTKIYFLVALATSVLSTQPLQAQGLLDLLRTIGNTATNPAPASTPVPTAASTPNNPPPPPAPAVSAPAATPAPAPAPAFDPKPVFMSVVTNLTLITNRVIVTNYVVVTNLTFTTNFYNAQGQLLTLVQPGMLPAPTAAPVAPVAPPPPDPAVVRSNQVQAIRELLSQSLLASSNQLAKAGSFTATLTNQIPIPDGVTVFDRRKGQNLVTAMNTAAEKAVPSACAAIQQQIAQLSPADPAQVIKGGSDAATRALISADGQAISDQLLLAVQAAAPDAQLPGAFSAAMLRGGGLLGAVLGTSSSVDINAHVAHGLMQALMVNLAAQEAAIRSDPSARKSKLLQDTFK